MWSKNIGGERRIQLRLSRGVMLGSKWVGHPSIFPISQRRMNRQSVLGEYLDHARDTYAFGGGRDTCKSWHSETIDSRSSPVHSRRQGKMIVDCVCCRYTDSGTCYKHGGDVSVRLHHAA